MIIMYKKTGHGSKIADSPLQYASLLVSRIIRHLNSQTKKLYN